MSQCPETDRITLIPSKVSLTMQEAELNHQSLSRSQSISKWSTSSLESLFFLQVRLVNVYNIIISDLRVACALLIQSAYTSSYGNLNWVEHSQSYTFTYIRVQWNIRHFHSTFPSDVQLDGAYWQTLSKSARHSRQFSQALVSSSSTPET